MHKNGWAEVKAVLFDVGGVLFSPPQSSPSLRWRGSTDYLWALWCERLCLENLTMPFVSWREEN
ncbi:hypothetical protein GBAR_LOCUS26952 [Geodia barretti]|uniref:Uncharacterized protein n=1 Tax=Geodia barretti TaxID=519541 RepID=A0AA35XE05_GEOBA|nr:hypothetical protein GBAR_LOCUS26952 [Geodia barretti]